MNLYELLIRMIPCRACLCMHARSAGFIILLADTSHLSCFTPPCLGRMDISRSEIASQTSLQLFGDDPPLATAPYIPHNIPRLVYPTDQTHLASNKSLPRDDRASSCRHQRPCLTYCRVCHVQSQSGTTYPLSTNNLRIRFLQPGRSLSPPHTKSLNPPATRVGLASLSQL